MQALNIKDRVSELLPIALASATARSIIIYLAERSRHRTDTDLKRLKYDIYHAGLLVDDRDYMAFWEELALSGHVGKLIRATVTDEPVMDGDKPLIKDGKPVIHKTQKSAKFHWTFSCKSFAQQMIVCMKAEGHDPYSAADMSLARMENGGKKPRGPNEKKTKVVETKDPLKTMVRIKMGEAQIFVPYGLTIKEAKAISDKLLSIAK